MLYPVNLNITGRLCLVIGGGAVAARKIESLLLSDAVVRVVSPEACRIIRSLSGEGRIEWLQRTYRDSDLQGAFLVFAATDHRVTQEQIAAQARKCGVLINSADNPEQCDFQVPAKLRRGDLLIAVSTDGGSPALSTMIKHRLSNEYGPEYGILVSLMSALRRQVVTTKDLSEQNKLLFHKVLALPVVDMIREGRLGELEKQLESVMPATIDCHSLIAAIENEVAQLRQHGYQKIVG